MFSGSEPTLGNELGIAPSPSSSQRYAPHSQFRPLRRSSHDGATPSSAFTPMGATTTQSAGRSSKYYRPGIDHSARLLLHFAISHSSHDE